MNLGEITGQASDADWLVIRSCSDSKLAVGHYSLSVLKRVAVVAAGLRPIALRHSLVAAEYMHLFSYL